jgi:hypothetical protein
MSGRIEVGHVGKRVAIHLYTKDEDANPSTTIDMAPEAAMDLVKKLLNYSEKAGFNVRALDLNTWRKI